ncbi:MAG: type III polyketide synthase [Bacteroidetes bacterium]|nr:type III polyketide synthase [Bacteroidota bacterium]
MSRPHIYSIGTALPLFKIAQTTHHDLLQASPVIGRKQKLQIRKVYGRTGIDYRHSVLEEFGKPESGENILFFPSDQERMTPVSTRMKIFEEQAPDLCMKAVNECLSQVDEFDIARISHIVTFSCTGMYAPGLDIQLVERLALNKNVERTCVNFMGCYAAINAIKSAYYIAKAEPDAVVLIVGIELCTLHYQKNETEDQIVANALFADGAAAAIISSASIQRSDEAPVLALDSFYAEFESAGKEEMAWRIGDHGFDLKLSAYVPDLIERNIRTIMEKIFDRAGLTQEDISFYALHPGGVSILEACEKALGINKEQNKYSYDVLRNHGNMSSVTILFVLKEYMKNLRRTDTGRKMLAYAFGPGLTMESMIAEVSITHKKNKVCQTSPLEHTI